MRHPVLPVVAISALLPAAQPPLAFDRYHSPEEANAALQAFKKANAGRAAIHKLATSRGGTDLLLLEVGPEAGKAVHNLPAILVVANLEGVLPVATEGALYLAQRLMAEPELAKDRTWYILPNGNPDAAWRYFRKPLWADERNAGKWNDDMDDAVDEDGPDDLDGNGLITQMRVKDPQGEWMIDPADRRLLARADPTKGEKGLYKLYLEGIDNDGDGLLNDDPAGGVDLGIAFPHLWKAQTATGGRWPGAEPETFGLIQFAVEHREIAMTLALGATNMCLQPPAGGRSAGFDSNAIRVPERLAGRFGLDANRTYTMKEIMEAVRPMMPPGMELTESMVGSFIGSGPVVNPLEDDLKTYKELSERFKEFLKSAKLDAKRLDPPQPKDGSFELWSYYHLGLPTFTMDFWTLPDPKVEEKDKAGITPEALEQMTPEAFVALGETQVAAMLKEVGAPPNFKAADLIEGVKGGRLTPKAMAGMMKNLPKPKETGGSDPRQKALLAFSDKNLNGRGFVSWTPVKHPQFGEAEVGGAVPYADTTPPAAMVKGLVEGQIPWLFKLSEKLPRLRILKSEVKAKGAGVFGIEVWVENTSTLSWPTAMGRRNKHVGPAVLQLSGKDVHWLSGRPRTPIQEVDGGRSVKFQWLVRGTEGTRLDLILQSPNAWGDTARLELRGTEGGAK